MAEKTKIAWTESTWNPIRGCSRVSAGCWNCYAEKMAARFSGQGKPYEGLIGPEKKWTGAVRFVPEILDQPLRWTRPRRIFVCSMSDLFHHNVDPSWRDRIFTVMALAPQHTFQIVTKRPQRMFAYCSALTRERLIPWANLSADGGLHRPEAYNLTTIAHKAQGRQFFTMQKPPLRNVWLGVSVENQETADERIPLLLQTPAAIRWVSYEPAIGPVDFRAIRYDNMVEIDALTGDHGVLHPLAGRSDRKLDWIVVGGEAGPHARPFDVRWARDVVAQCKAAGVPVFVKQLGSIAVSDDKLGKGIVAAAEGVKGADGMNRYTWLLKNSKGGNPDEWPEDLRVREYPAVKP